MSTTDTSASAPDSGDQPRRGKHRREDIPDELISQADRHGADLAASDGHGRGVPAVDGYGRGLPAVDGHGRGLPAVDEHRAVPGLAALTPAAPADANQPEDLLDAELAAHHAGPASDGGMSGEEGRSDNGTNFGLALRIPEFRALWFADTASVLGTQVSRVCLSLIVFQATGSAAATALVYALTFVPTIVGGALLSGLADRLPRRAVMIVTDLVRAGLFGVMAIPELSIVLTSALLVIAVLLDSPFRAAQTATLPDVLPGDSYSAGIALRTISLQAAQLAGYAVGGLLAAVVGARFGLAIDAMTFLLSALVIARWVKKRPVPPREPRNAAAARDYLSGIGDGLRFILGTPRLRILAGLAVLSGFYVVPEGLAAPYAAVIGGGSISVGLLMAADPAGSAVGAWLYVRLVRPAARTRWMAALAIGPGLVMIPLLLHPGLYGSIAIWAAAGALSSFQIPASVEFVRDLPDEQRGQSLGIVVSAMLTAQGLGVLIAGLLASRTDPTTAIVVFGIVGAVIACYLALRWHRVGDAEPSVPSQLS